VPKNEKMPNKSNRAAHRKEGNEISRYFAYSVLSDSSGALR
jgi:hypothetical protein